MRVRGVGGGGEGCMNAGDLCSRETARRRRCTHSAVALSWEWVTSRCNVQRCAAARAQAMCVQSGQILVVQAFMLALWQTLHTMGTYPSILKYSEHGSTFTWIQNISCMCKQQGSVPYDFCILPHESCNPVFSSSFFPMQSSFCDRLPFETGLIVLYRCQCLSSSWISLWTQICWTCIWKWIHSKCSLTVATRLYIDFVFVFVFVQRQRVPISFSMTYTFTSYQVLDLKDS